MKKIIAVIILAAMALTLVACSSGTSEKKEFTIGICNFVDDASLNQIIENIENQLKVIEEKNNVTIKVKVDNCNMDFNVLNQIISDFIIMAMQAATEDNQIPVVFAAVSDPVGAELVDSLEKPGANLTGTSDYLDTNAVMNLIFALNPDASKIGLLYNPSEDSSSTPIAAAKEYLDSKGIAYVERTGTNTSEVMLAAQALVADKVDAVFTPTDNTIMKAELAIYETFAEAGIPHYTGADSFALNGAFLGYGVDYANLGVETANIIAEILVNGMNPGEVPVMTFDNGTATVNTDTCTALGLSYDDVAAKFAPYCTKVQPITTAESFSDLN